MEHVILPASEQSLWQCQRTTEVEVHFAAPERQDLNRAGVEGDVIVKEGYFPASTPLAVSEAN